MDRHTQLKMRLHAASAELTVWTRLISLLQEQHSLCHELAALLDEQQAELATFKTRRPKLPDHAGGTPRTHHP